MPRRAFADLDDLRDESDFGILARIHLRGDFPTARAWEDQVTRLKADVAIAVVRLQA